MYDFEKYYADMDVKADVNIDLSGVRIENPQGNPNEHVTNNVAYYIIGAQLANNEYFSGASTLGMNDRVMISVTDADRHTKLSYFSLYQPLNDLVDADVMSQWHPGKNKETSVVLDASNDTATITYTVIHDNNGGTTQQFTYARLFVNPRYEFMTGNGQSNVITLANANQLSPLSVNQNIISLASNTRSLPQTMQVIYSILGIGGRRKTSMKWIRTIGSKTTKANAVIDYDVFRKRMDAISGWCAENNYGVTVKCYDSSFSTPLPDNIVDATDDEYRKSPRKAAQKHNAYIRACYNADITRTTMPRYTSFNDAYGKYLGEFIGNGTLTQELIDDLRSSGDGVTAIIPPIKDAVRGMFYPREDIESNFYEEFENVFEQLKDAMSIMRQYLSNTTKRQIDEINRQYTNKPDDNNGLAFDLDSILNILQANYLRGKSGGNAENAAIQCPGPGGVEPQAGSSQNITAFPRIFQINGEYVSDAGGYVSWGIRPGTLTNMRTFSQFIASEANYGPLLGWTNVDDYCNYWQYINKSTVTMNADEVREMLVNLYNWIIEQEDVDPIDINTLDTDFSHGYDGSDTSAVVQYCKRFIQFVGGWMNLFRNKKKEDVWRFVEEHRMNPGETIMAWLYRLKLENDGLFEWTLNGDYTIISWAKAVTTSNSTIKWKYFVPAEEYDWGINPDSPEDIDKAVKAAYVMKKTYKEMRSQLVAHAFIMNPITVAKAWMALENVSDALDDLNETIDRIVWYQAFVNETVFTNKSMYLDRDNWISNRGGNSDTDDGQYIQLPFTPWTLPARFMVPVALYRKVKKKYRTLFGRTRHKTVKVFDGVRWAEVRFYDLNIYNEYPQVEETPGNTIPLGKSATIEHIGEQWVVNFDEALPEEVWNAASGELTFDDISSTTLQVEFDDEMSAHVLNDVDPPTLVGEHIVVSVKVPPEHSRNDSENKTPVTIHLKAPALPYDEEIRKRAFVEYGPLSQDKLFEVVRYGDGGFPNVPEEQRFDGWKVFRPTSRKIEDMREGIGLYDKVAFLMSILIHEFGSGRVELINTWRSAADQKGICTGGPESSMLSWHNYGMAAKILIYKADGTTPIEDKSDDMKHLVKVARAFTEICGDGRIGAPCNVVWCGRLTINPSLFDWEFLPIGVGHKDAFKFREAIMAQRDPIKECAYVDADAGNLVKGAVPDGNIPYILKSSSAYKNAIIINGHHYVSPDRIMNYNTPEDIVLYDIVEYIELISLKMNANGNKLGDRRNMYEWKSLNDSACTQLIRYFALTNNIKSAKALIAGDFVEKYQAIEDAYYSTSAIEYVKHMLGDHYDEVYINIDSMSDAGYISLSNGKLYIKVHDILPDNVPTILDMHKQQRVDNQHIRRGVWRGGVFYGLDEIEMPYIESDGPVIDGYVNERATFGSAMFLHQAVASELHAEFLKIRDMFEQYQGAVMYDRFQDGPNADKFNQLENEFGAIAAQDLMDFDELDAMLAQEEINRLADIESNGERNGIITESDKINGNGKISIYEKVVNNAQLAGMRKALKTSERMHITDKGNGLTPGEIYRAVMEGRAPGANDLMSRN